jgi:hypothetical protein
MNKPPLIKSDTVSYRVIVTYQNHSSNNLIVLIKSAGNK